jgi:Uma2 family endonuclease
MPHAIVASMAMPPYPESIPVPASARFPIELEPPAGFRVDDLGTWPAIDGRLEYVDGRLLWMPPCGLRQQLVAVSAVGALRAWAKPHREFLVGGNEAGLLFGDDARGAEAAVWRRESLPSREEDAFVRVPPILAVEVAGRDEGERELRDKARWYLARGVRVVWVVLPATRDVLVVEAGGETRRARGQRLPAHAELPGLAPSVDDFFDQLD